MNISIKQYKILLDALKSCTFEIKQFGEHVEDAPVLHIHEYWFNREKVEDGLKVLDDLSVED